MHLIQERVLGVCNDVVDRHHMPNGLKQVSLALGNVHEWAVRKSNALCHSSDQSFKADDKVVDLLCLLVVEVAHHLEDIEEEGLPVAEENDAFDAQELEEGAEGFKFVLRCHVEQDQAIERQ
jgi:hypothetical protein